MKKALRMKMIENGFRHSIDMYSRNDNVLITDWLFSHASEYNGPVYDLDIDEELYEEISGWVEAFYEMEKKVIFNRITHLIIEFVDRGIRSWRALGNLIALKFPNLEIFEMEQNFSFNERFTEEDYVSDFTYFLERIHFVKKLYINDDQSSFFAKLSNDDIFKFIPDGGLYILNLSYDSNCKLTSERRGNKELFVSL